MASKDRKTRYLEAATLVFALFLDAKAMIGQETESLDPVEAETSGKEALRLAE